MKKILALTIFALSFTQPLFAQYNKVITHKPKEKTSKKEVFYARIGVGYALPLAGQTGDASHYGFYNGSFTQTASQYNFDAKKASFGAGLWGYVAGGCMFSKHIGIDISLHVGLASKKYTNEYDDQSATPATYTTNVQYANFPVIFNPSLVVASGGDVNVYARFGVAIPMSSKIKDEETIVYDNGPAAAQSTDNLVITTKSNFSLGLTSAAGINIIINGVTVFAEVNTLSMSLYAQESTLTSYNRNGINLLPRVTNTKINFSYNGSGQPVYAVPFSYVGFSAGITLGM